MPAKFNLLDIKIVSILRGRLRYVIFNIDLLYKSQFGIYFFFSSTIKQIKIEI